MSVMRRGRECEEGRDESDEERESDEGGRECEEGGMRGRMSDEERDESVMRGGMRV